MARKYSPAASEDVEREMREFNRGELKSGRSGKTVMSRKQAIAIGLSEARREGKKVPPAPRKPASPTTSKRAAVSSKGTTAKRSSSKRSASKRTASKHATAKRSRRTSRT
jgi:hypothetical protein